MSRRFIVAVAQNYASNWLSWFVFTLVIALVVNAIWHVGLFEVADTTLAIALSYVIVLICIDAYLAAQYMIEGKIKLALFVIVYAVFFALLPFACVLAFRFYGWVGTLTGTGHPLDNFVADKVDEIKNYSSIVQIYLDFWKGATSHIASWLGDFGDKVLGISTPGWLKHVGANDKLPQWISALTAAAALLWPRRQIG